MRHICVMSNVRSDGSKRPFSQTLRRLKDAGLRPTRQRLALGKILFDAGDCHITAEQLHDEAISQGIKVSLATVYNTLNQFTDTGLLREVVVSPGRSYFDTNINEHHHFFFEDDGALKDIPHDAIELARLPDAPSDAEVTRVDVIVRLRRAGDNRFQ
jgi:Fur family iron response transcriptional regulator